jgi:glycosyltransferase involved in cell wall biosynthesis
MAAGKPVIGVSEGGLLETVVDGITGKLLKPDPAVDELIDAVQSFTANHTRDMKQACEQQAQKFSRSVFLERMRQAIDCA